MRRATALPWILLLASVAVVAVAAGVHALRPAAPLPQSSELCGPDAQGIARLRAKQRIVDELIDGRLTLLSAAARFQALDAVGTPYPAPWAAYPAAPEESAEEEYCHMVIGWVRGLAPPGRADDLACSLEAELAARRRAGTLRLPD